MLSKKTIEYFLALRRTTQQLLEMRVSALQMKSCVDRQMGVDMVSLHFFVPDSLVHTPF